MDPTTTVRRPGRRFRSDIEGLRAVAILAVVGYHAHLGHLDGGYVGVDVFFVISGFLITDQLWRELTAAGRISFAAFYARRMRRLLPAAVVVLVATMAASAIWLPPLQTRSVWKDGVASALYVGNYRFALARTDYLAPTLLSPFQHYWSLGVEEQFYLVWPLLLGAAAAAALAWRRQGRGQPTGRSPSRPRPGAVTAAVGAVGVGSFFFSLWLTHADEPWAFFSLPSRAWELAAGGLVALATPAIRRFLPAVVAAPLGWLGLGAIVWSAFAFTASTAFPGTAALAPVLGAAAVMAAGVVHPAAGPVVVLGRVAMRAVGRISYSWYLWHWPVFVIAPYVVGRSLSGWAYLGLAVASGAMAVVTYRFVERPFLSSAWLRARPGRSLVFGTSLSLAGIVACLGAVATLPSTMGHGRAPVAAIRLPPPATTVPRGRAAARPSRPRPSPAVTALADAEAQAAAAVVRSAPRSDVPANLDPSLADAAGSEAAPFVDGCLLSYESTSSPPCLFGDTGSRRSMVLFGDSHATMWFPAVDAYANAAHLSLRVLTKATCPPIELSIFSPALGREFSECDEWKRSVLAEIAALRPQLVVVGMAPNYDLAYQVVQDGPPWLRGLSQMIETIRRSGARVVVMGPVPSPDNDVADCLSAHLRSMQTCAVRATGGPDGNGLFGYDTAGLAAEQRAAEAAGAYFVDVRAWFCTATTCPPVIDNLLVYKDNSHLTVPLAQYLAPLVVDELRLGVQAGRRS